jgi:hypothetical protein
MGIMIQKVNHLSVHSPYKITTYTHLVGYCTFFGYFFYHFHFILWMSGSPIRILQFELWNTQWQRGKINKHKAQVCPNIKWQSIDILFQLWHELVNFFFIKGYFRLNINYLLMWNEGLAQWVEEVKIYADDWMVVHQCNEQYLEEWW